MGTNTISKKLGGKQLRKAPDWVISDLVHTQEHTIHPHTCNGKWFPVNINFSIILTDHLNSGPIINVEKVMCRQTGVAVQRQDSRRACVCALPEDSFSQSAIASLLMTRGSCAIVYSSFINQQKSFFFNFEGSKFGTFTLWFLGVCLFVCF